MKINDILQSSLSLFQNLALKNKHDTIVSKVYIPSSEKGFDDLIKPY